ncbi:MAG: type II secretion system protein [Candidatus Omnitrophica bacterium]|nr:type II secretion system protein [Candidatus Omnitrophota bacterium]
MMRCDPRILDEVEIAVRTVIPVRSGVRAFALIEVLLSMTLLAITGTVLMRSISNAVDYTRDMRDLTKMIYLTQLKLHEFELAYNRRANMQLGDFEGRFTQPGAEHFHWYARVEYDRRADAYLITVRTISDEQSQPLRRNRRWRSRNFDEGGFVLRSMVLTARFNEELVRGGNPQVRRRGPESGPGGGPGTGGQRGGTQRGGRR